MTITDFVYVICPSCNRSRLLKEKHFDGRVDEISNNKIVAIDGTERYTDICIFCIIKFSKRDREYIKQRALQLSREAKGQSATTDISL